MIGVICSERHQARIAQLNAEQRMVSAMKKSAERQGKTVIVAVRNSGENWRLVIEGKTRIPTVYRKETTK